MAVKNMPPTYSGTEYMTSGQPTVRCDRCQRDVNRLQSYRSAGGVRECITCARDGMPPMVRSVVPWTPERG